MSIWAYQEALLANESTLGLRSNRGAHLLFACPFCGTKLTFLGRQYGGGLMPDWHSTEIHVCQACGWWNLESYTSSTTPVLGANFDCESSETRYAHGTIRNLDVTDIRTPLAELTRYLVARWDRVGEVNPALVEQTVAAVFRNADFDVEITARSGDGGIDLVLLRGPRSQRVGVQVKRNKRRVEAEQVRAFAAALRLKDMKYGIFVATGGYRSGAQSVVQLATLKDLAYIELRDGAWLLEELCVRQRPCYENINETGAPWRDLLANLASVPCVSQTSVAVDHQLLW